MHNAPKKLFLLDAFALIYRAHFAFVKTPRVNSKGNNTSIPFGFTNVLLEVIQKQKPSHIGVAFDTPKATFRSDLFTDYKANREETPEDIQYGVATIKKIIEGFNIPIFEKDGYEADDIIGTVATQITKEDFEVYIMTSDKDFGQLVNEKIFLYKPAYMGDAVKIMGVAEVCEKWNISNVSQVIDILGLQGDASDNIPGIPGIGPKTAAVLLKQYGTVENIVANAGQLKGKQKERVTEYGSQALLSKKLATIIVDVPLKFDQKMLEYTAPNEDILRPIFEELEFKAITKRIFGEANKAGKSTHSIPSNLLDPQATKKQHEITPKKAQIPSQGRTLLQPEERAALREQLMEQDEISIEVLIDGNVHSDFELTGLVFSFPQNTYYIPTTSLEATQAIAEEFSPVFSSNHISKIGHDIKRSILALKKYGVIMEGPLFDIMLAHYLLEAEQSHELETLAANYLGYELPSDEDEKKNICGRVEAIFLLAQPLKEELERKGHIQLMTDIESPLIMTLADMEHEGIRIDEKILDKLSKELTEESKKVQCEIYQLAGTEFNIASPKQVGKILFEKLRLVEKPKKTKTGQYATGEEVLKKLSKEHHIVSKMLSFREYEKLRTTYVDALPKLVYKSDRRIHTNYKQTVASTGRLSSTNPNLQNIPIRTEKGRQIRKAFIPKNEKYLLMSADYSQIELRIAAAFAQDETMIEAFRTGRDIHATTAAKIFNTPLQKIKPDMRRKAKEVNFGILYGSGPFGLAQNLNTTRSEAAEIIESYFQEFHSIRRYMDDSIALAREKGYVETILGRRRYLRDISSRNSATRGFAERNAINAPIQGSAADIIKIAMLHIHRWLKHEKLKTKMLLQVHDELIFDLYAEEEIIVKPKIVELMKTAVLLDVPMEVEIGVGKNWLEAH